MTRAKLIKKWSGGRKQQRGWAAKMEKKGRAKRVFYDEMVELGHRIVVRNKAGELVDTGKRAKPVYFARRAAEQGAEQALDAAETEVMNFIVGG
jgi:plasmid replication initiation protein